jgi:hypothetical protein
LRPLTRSRHEKVRELALAHLEPGQRTGLGDERVKLVAFGQALVHSAGQVAEPLEDV